MKGLGLQTGTFCVVHRLSQVRERGDKRCFSTFCAEPHDLRCERVRAVLLGCGAGNPPRNNACQPLRVCDPRARLIMSSYIYF